MTERIFMTRPEELPGITTTVPTHHGSCHLTVNYYRGQPIEVFVHLGHAGSDERAFAEAIGRLLSVALQHGVEAEVLWKQLRGISSEAVMGFGPNRILSIPDAVGKTLQEIINEASKST